MLKMFFALQPVFMCVVTCLYVRCNLSFLRLSEKNKSYHEDYDTDV